MDAEIMQHVVAFVVGVVGTQIVLFLLRRRRERRRDRSVR